MATSRNLPAARQSKPPASASTKSPTRSRVINVNYNINNESDGGGWKPSGGTGTQGRTGGGPNWLNTTRGVLGSPARQVSTPPMIPRWLGNQKIVAYSWIVAMVAVGWDEWKNHGILPRPVRLWDTSIVYGLLTLVSFIDIMVPIANALAIGYTIVLLYQLYNHTGQFGSTE